MLELHVTCVIFNICNIYTKCLIVFIWVGFGKFGKLGFDCLEKDDQTDCKFICGVADEDIMKSET